MLRGISRFFFFSIGTARPCQLCLQSNNRTIEDNCREQALSLIDIQPAPIKRSRWSIRRTSTSRPPQSTAPGSNREKGDGGCAQIVNILISPRLDLRRDHMDREYCSPSGTPNSPVDLVFFAGKAEPKRLALVSEDGQFKGALAIEPFSECDNGQRMRSGSFCESIHTSPLGLESKAMRHHSPEPHQIHTFVPQHWTKH